MLLICILLVFLFAAFCLFVFIGVDSIGIDNKPVAAVVTAKHFSPETTTTTFIDVAGIQVPQTSTVPPLWYASGSMESSRSDVSSVRLSTADRPRYGRQRRGWRGPVEWWYILRLIPP